MEYKYRFTTVEILDYGVNMVWQAIRKFWRIWLVLAVFLAVTSNIRWKEVFLLNQVMVLTLLRVVGYSLLLAAGFLVLLFLAAIYLMERRFRNTDLQMIVKDGRLTMTVGESCWQYSCTEIIRVEKRGRFIAIELKTKGRGDEIFLLPRRMFAGVLEQRQFLEFVERQRNYARETSEFGWQSGAKSINSGENGNESADFNFQTQWNEQMLRELKEEVSWINAQSGFSTETYRMLGLLIGILLLMRAVMDLLRGKGELISLLFTGIILMAVLWFMAHRGMKKKPVGGVFEKILRPVLKTNHRLEEMLTSQIIVGQKNIFVREGGNEARISWKDMAYLLESGPWFLIYNAKKHPVLHFPKKSLGDEEEQKRFEKYCQEHGLEYRSMRPDDTEGKKGAKGKSVGERIAFAAGIFFLICVVVSFILPVVMIVIRKPDPATFQEELTTEYVFHPEDFEHYLPLEKQVGVLKSLGIKVPEKILKEERDWMEEYPSSREWIEGEPYYTLLSDLGYPVYDEETYEIKSYSNQMYTVDWDGYDLTEDYVSLLNGVNAISRGEYTLTSPAVILDGVDMDSLTGTTQIYFLLNGTPYLYELEADGYYLDTRVLRCLNEAFGKEQIPGRLYGADYDGWSCILFYQDREWAAEFTGKTGIPLILEYVRE